MGWHWGNLTKESGESNLDVAGTSTSHVFDAESTQHVFHRERCVSALRALVERSATLHRRIHYCRCRPRRCARSVIRSATCSIRSIPGAPSTCSSAARR